MGYKITEVPFERFPFVSELASYSLGWGHFSPAVGKETTDTGYYLRILESRYQSRNGTTRNEWEYFKTDSTGLIIESPRGMAKIYNKRYRILGLEKAVEDYKDKVINQ